MDQLPTELHHIICSYLNFDNCKDYQSIFAIKLNHEILFSIKYHELYPSIKKVINIDNLEVDWKFLNEEFVKIDYHILLEYHKYNVESLDDCYSMDHVRLYSLNYSTKSIIFNTLIIKDWPNCYRFKNRLIDKGFNNTGEIVYEILTDYQLKSNNIMQKLFSDLRSLSSTIGATIKTGHLIDKIDYLDIRPKDNDDMIYYVRPIAMLTIAIFSDTSFKWDHGDELIKDFEKFIYEARDHPRCDNIMNKKILEILKNDEMYF